MGQIRSKLRAPRGNRTDRVRFAILVAALFTTTVAPAQWVVFRDQSATRLVADPEVGSADVAEKDFAWGDVDLDGDVDLIVVRKQPFGSPGKRTNVLLLNEDGVLVDRTLDFATAADVGCCGSPVDLGFLTPTNDRDVALVDVDLDGWLDVVTAPTISDGDPKHIGHPRIYRNLGCSGDCAGTADWLGFRYEEARIPSMLSYSGQSGHNPRFCAVAAGDVTGDGYPDLWFSDYDSGQPPQPPGADFNDRLLVNLGAANPGTFVDVTNEPGGPFPGQIVVAGVGSFPFEVSAFGAAGVIADLNGDGAADLVKQTALEAPQYVGVAYNDPFGEGTFGPYEVVNQQAPYFVSVADLNEDGLLDLVISDDGADRYALNQGNGPDGLANFVSYPFAFGHIGAGGAASDDGEASNSVAADLNKDGLLDVVIADVDVEFIGCDRRVHFFENLGGAGGTGAFVSLREQTVGSGCQTFFGNPPQCEVVGIASDGLEGVHDVAVFDLDRDGWMDVVLGRCEGTAVYMNAALTGSVFVDKDVYECDDTLQVTVGERFPPGPLNPEVTVAVASDTEPDAEIVTLAETDSGIYTATLTLGEASASSGDGLLSVSPGDTITVQYLDEDDGLGGSDLLREVTAEVNCSPPVITNVHVGSINYHTVAVSWDTDELSDTLVRYGLEPPGDLTSSSSEMVLSHSRALTGLQCKDYFFSVHSTDSAGNTSDDDNGGNFYTLRPDCGQAPPIPDGTAGTQPVTAWINPVVGIWVQWDNQCATGDAKLVYGPLDTVEAYEISGAVCFVPPSLDATLWPWSQVPAESAWFLVIRENEAGLEGSWGQATSGERNPTAVTGQCAGTTRDLQSTCP